MGDVAPVKGITIYNEDEKNKIRGIVVRLYNKTEEGNGGRSLLALIAIHSENKNKMKKKILGNFSSVENRDIVNRIVVMRSDY